MADAGGKEIELGVVDSDVEAKEDAKLTYRRLGLEDGLVAGEHVVSAQIQKVMEVVMAKSAAAGNKAQQMAGLYSGFTVLTVVGQIAALISYIFNNYYTGLCILAIIGVSAGGIGLVFKIVAEVMKRYEPEGEHIKESRMNFYMASEAIVVAMATILQITSVVVIGRSDTNPGDLN